MSYEPLPGTVPARAIAHLKTLPLGKEISTAALAEVIDCDKGSLSSCLAMAKKQGLVNGRISPGALFTVWSAGKGVPLPGPADADDDEPLGAAPAAPLTAANSVFDIARGASEPDAPPPKATTKAAQVVGKESREGHADQRPPAQAVRFALWSDGALQIERDGCDNVLLAPDQTKAMLAYLDRLREREVA